MSPYENQTIQISKKQLLVAAILPIVIQFMTANMNVLEPKNHLEVHSQVHCNIYNNTNHINISNLTINFESLLGNHNT